MVKKYVFIKSVQRYDKFLGIAKELLQLELNNFIMKIDQTRMSSKISSK